MKIPLDISFFLSGVPQKSLSVRFYHSTSSFLSNFISEPPPFRIFSEISFLCQYSLSNLFLSVKFPFKIVFFLSGFPQMSPSFFWHPLSNLLHFFKFLSKIFSFVLCFPWNENVSHSVMSDSATSLTVPARLLCPRNSSGKNTGVGGHSILQGLFWIQGFKQSPALWAVSLSYELPGKPMFPFISDRIFS